MALSSDQSYQIYKEFLYESDLVQFRMTRLIAVVYMEKQDIIDSDDGTDNDSDDQSDQDEQSGEGDSDEEKDDDTVTDTDGDQNDEVDESENVDDNGDLDSNTDTSIGKVSCSLIKEFPQRTTSYYLEDDHHHSLRLHMNPINCNRMDHVQVEHYVKVIVDEVPLPTNLADLYIVATARSD